MNYTIFFSFIYTFIAPKNLNARIIGIYSKIYHDLFSRPKLCNKLMSSVTRRAACSVLQKSYAVKSATQGSGGLNISSRSIYSTISLTLRSRQSHFFWSLEGEDGITLTISVTAQSCNSSETTNIVKMVNGVAIETIKKTKTVSTSLVETSKQTKTVKCAGQ